VDTIAQPEESRNTPGFILMILVTGVVFFRPAEVFPEFFGGWPLYQVLLFACLAITFPDVLARLGGRSLAAQPLSACVLGLFGAMVLSDLTRGEVGPAAHVVIDSLKWLLYYFLLISVLDSPSRLRCFLLWLAVFIIAHALFAVLNWHGLFKIPGVVPLRDFYVDKATGTATTVDRLRTTGLYEGPNSFSHILSVCMIICVYVLSDRRAGLFRVLVVVPIGLLGHAFALTKSRGGLLDLMAGVLFFLATRLGWRRALPLVVLIVPALLAVFAGRQAELSTSTNTAKDRIDLWGLGYSLLREAPVFGVGRDNFRDRAGIVIHNSYLHAYVEGGVIGGTFLLGAFVCALWGTGRINARRLEFSAPELHHLQPYVMAILAAYAVGLLSLSRVDAECTYTVLGVAAAFIRLSAAHTPEPSLTPLRLNARLVVRLAAVSVAFLVGGHLFCIYSRR
jgi:O-antigen ligase